ncbi:MAG: 3-aminobutyryl-CoA ammonia lyase [Actinobacteria bacterium]|nr:3-aminobutyryl-CoA ammonia lyase [Actinomycetota bacterium]
MIRIRMSSSDVHYGGDLVSGAKILELFGDVATELLIKNDGDEGLFAGYKKIDFLVPVYAGDYIEARGEITRIGSTSRDIVFEAYKVIQTRKDISDSAADFLDEPILVVRAKGTCVVKKENQRKQ